MNALAAIGAAEHLGVTPDVAAQALGRFENVRRRMEFRGEVAGMAIHDDFVPHPTAIRTTLDGLRRKIGPEGRILAVFEPRSNTMKLGAMKTQLPWALEEADLSFCLQGEYCWSAAEALARLSKKAQVLDHFDALVAVGRPCTVHEQRSFGDVHAKLLCTLASRR